MLLRKSDTARTVTWERGQRITAQRRGVCEAPLSRRRDMGTPPVQKSLRTPLFSC